MTFISSSRAFVLSALAITILACTAGVAPTVLPSLSDTAIPSAADTVFLASDAWSSKPGTVFELFSVGAGSQTRLTTCAGCQTLGASPSLDRNRVVTRRVTADTNRDGRLDAAGHALRHAPGDATYRVRRAARPAIATSLARAVHVRCTHATRTFAYS